VKAKLRSAKSLVLINPPSLCVDDDRLEPPLGLLYLAAAARKAGHCQVIFEDLSGCRDESETQTRIDAVPEADAYGISSFCTNHEFAKRLVARIRQQTSSAYVVLGGPNPSALPELTMADIGADAVVVGEGEDAFVTCLASHAAGRPLCGVVQGTGREDVDSYPFPARDLVDMGSYSRRLRGEPVISVLSSRGCPHKCAFCNSVVMGGGAARVRYRTADNLMREIATLRGMTRSFRFNDDCFTANPHLGELLTELARLDIVFRVFARVEDLTATTCRALHAAGCVHVAVGLESLNPENLRALGKGRQIGHERNVQLAKDAGLVVRAYFMVGLPHDSDASIQRDFTMAASLGLDEFTVYPLIPYPGTKIAQEPERFGYTIVNGDYRDYIQVGLWGRACYALRHRNFGPEDVKRWKLQADEILLSRGLTRSHQSPVAL